MTQHIINLGIGWKNQPTKPYQPHIPVICGQSFVNNTGNHGGTLHECDLRYHATGMHHCRLCGARGN